MTIKNTEERKQLEKRIAELKAKWEAARDDVYRAEAAQETISADLKQLRQRLEALKPKAITISDHAIVRYLERQAGIDVEAIRKSILDSSLPSMVGALGGSGKFPINGYQVVLKDYTVVTIN